MPHTGKSNFLLIKFHFTISGNDWQLANIFIVFIRNFFHFLHIKRFICKLGKKFDYAFYCDRFITDLSV
jgi:hypothetical protein